MPDMIGYFKYIKDMVTGYLFTVDETATLSSKAPKASPTFTTKITTPIIDLTGGQVAFPATQAASADANTLDDYQEYTAASTNCSGALTVATTWKATKTGNQVTLTLPYIHASGASTEASFYVGTVALPADFRPAVALFFPCIIQLNGAMVNQPGKIFVRTSGEIQVYADIVGTGNFTSGQDNGLGGAIAVSWTI